MNDQYTEDDLRAALLDLGADAPAVRDVLPQRTAASRGRARWLAPLAVAVLVLALSVTAAVVRHNPHRTPTASHDVDQLTGTSWRLRHVGGRSVSGQTLYVEPNGRFFQNTFYCESLTGRATVSGDDVDITRVRRDMGLCPDAGPPVSKQQAAAIRALSQEFVVGQLSWSVRSGRLTLVKPGEPPLVYSRQATAPARAQTFTYRGVGVVVPSSWVKNAQHCGSPTRDTVLYPVPVLACLANEPSDVSSVRFEPSRVQDLIRKPEGEPSTVLIDGVKATERSTGRGAALQQVELDIPSRGVTLLISSPSRRTAFDLEQKVYLVDP